MASLLEKSVAYCLNIHRMGDKRKVDTSKVDLKDKQNGTTPDEDSITIAMQILKCDEYDAIVSLDRKVKGELEKLALPSPFKDSIYLIPITLIERIDTLVNNYKTKRIFLVDKFLGAYQAAIEDAKRRLNGLFNPDKYPSVDVVRSRFSVDTCFVQFGVPTALENISSELFAREQQESRARLQAQEEEIKLVLRSSMQGFVQNLLEAVTPGPDGKYKRFYESNVTNLKEFLTDFSDRNICDDKELEDLVSKAKNIINGVDVEKLRDSAGFKQSLQTSMSEIKKNISSLVVTQGRKFRFEDEEVPAAA